jgi:hypothetical protein
MDGLPPSSHPPLICSAIFYSCCVTNNYPDDELQQRYLSRHCLFDNCVVVYSWCKKLSRTEIVGLIYRRCRPGQILECMHVCTLAWWCLGVSLSGQSSNSHVLAQLLLDNPGWASLYPIYHFAIVHLYILLLSTIIKTNVVYPL